MNRRRKKPAIPWEQIIAAGIFFILLLAVIVLSVKLTGRSSEMKKLLGENESMKQELAAESYADRQGQGDEAAGPDGIIESDGITGSEDTTESDQTTKQDETTAAPETTPAETEPQPLKTLDGVAAGTVVTSQDLDTSQMKLYFQAYEIKTTGHVYSRINGKSYQENSNVRLGDLRYLKVLHYNFDHERQVGELIVNAELAEEVLEIFKELYDAEYEIESMHLVDNYWTGDADTSDSASIDVNNTSAFNYRAATGGSKLSNHAYGCAIDMNPQQNPYVSYKSGKASWSHKNANDYIARDTGLPHVITHEDTAFKTFKNHGFKWGGDWDNPKDYQHFEKKIK